MVESDHAYMEQKAPHSAQVSLRDWGESTQGRQKASVYASVSVYQAHPQCVPAVLNQRADHPQSDQDLAVFWDA